MCIYFFNLFYGDLKRLVKFYNKLKNDKTTTLKKGYFCVNLVLQANKMITIVCSPGDFVLFGSFCESFVTLVLCLQGISKTLKPTYIIIV